MSSVLEEQLRASVAVAQARKECFAANIALEQAMDRITDLQHENDRLRTQLLAKDLMIDVLKASTPALLRPQI
jgi:hypothetical protein